REARPCADLGGGGSSLPAQLLIRAQSSVRRDPPALPADSVSSLKCFGERNTRSSSRPFGYECLSRMSRHARKLRDHDTNPCVAETDATTKCMNDNNYNKDLCTDYFLKYKNCRTFW
ncbi:hypothetical protein HGM15179_005316, partial [Zosterops borbonicus]